jgi:hypothetical protein
MAAEAHRADSEQGIGVYTVMTDEKFEQWWKGEYEGKLSGSGFTIELAFKEVAMKAWLAATAATEILP